MKTMTGEIKAKGQLTVPKKIRDMLKLEEGQAVTFLAIGDSVIISPKRLDLDEARRQIRRIVKESGLTEEAILADLKRRETRCTGKSMAKREVKAFLDSNVIISGLISDRSSPRLILDLLCHDLPLMHAATWRYNLEEIERTITRKLPAARPVLHDFMSRLKIEIIPLPAGEKLAKYRGVIADEDLPVLVSAIECGADYLVTGDKKHFGGLRGRKDIPLKICSPSEFVEILATGIRELE